MDLAELLQNNYKELRQVAHRIASRKNFRSGPELLNVTYLEIHNTNSYPKHDKEFVKWFSRCMKYQFIGKRTVFNKSTVMQSNDLDIEPVDNSESVEAKEKHYNERSLKYAQVIKFKDSLPMHEKHLFDLYYVNGLSAREISKKLSEETGYDVNYQRINIMINSIKRKINKTKWQ